MRIHFLLCRMGDKLFDFPPYLQKPWPHGYDKTIMMFTCILYTSSRMFWKRINFFHFCQWHISVCSTLKISNAGLITKFRHFLSSTKTPYLLISKLYNLFLSSQRRPEQNDNITMTLDQIFKYVLIHHLSVCR